MNDQQIIIVEDEDKIAQILVDYLKKDGYKTFVLNDGTYAVEAIRDRDPLFVIPVACLPIVRSLSRNPALYEKTLDSRSTERGNDSDDEYKSEMLKNISQLFCLRKTVGRCQEYY